MASEKDIQALQERLHQLLKKQENFMEEVSNIQKVLDDMLKIQATATSLKQEQICEENTNSESIKPKHTSISTPQEALASAKKHTDEAPLPVEALAQKPWRFKRPEVFEKELQEKNNTTETPFSIPLPKTKSNFERFLGENLLSKIGILVLVIGVFIGVKYSIDNNLISPLVRVVLGYVAGGLLMIFGFKLKPKYESFSVVLVSGALTIFYFITYVGFDFYALFPKAVAFAMMFSFTAFAVLSSLNYNRQIIALLGLVGGYAVPFLLSDNSGNISALFTYIAIINIGIMVIFMLKKWEALRITAFSLTWLIYLIIRVFYYDDFYLHTFYIFCLVYFLTFHIPLIISSKKEGTVLGWTDSALMLCNSIFVFSSGYSLLEGSPHQHITLGLFTLANAVFHLLLAVFLRSNALKKNAYYLSVILALGFTTIVLPIITDSFLVTLFWGSEAAILFWIARSKKIPFYEWLSYPIMAITFFSLLHDWEDYHLVYFTTNSKIEHMQPFLNMYMFTSLWVVVAFAFLWYINRKYHNKRYTKTLSYVFGSAFVFLLYRAFYQEINYYWNLQLHAYDGIDWSYSYFKTLWLINYTLFFVASFILLIVYKVKENTIGYIALVAGFLSSFVFLTFGLYAISELRESYLLQKTHSDQQVSMMYLYIRYISLAFFAYLVFALNTLLQSDWLRIKTMRIVGLALHLTVLWVASSELLHWTDMYRETANYKLGISILWGLYAVFMVILGLFNRRRYVRLGGIALFGITLLKLFFYDIVHLSTIAKTIVFISLGVLLLLASFLYNKYTNRIEAEDEK